MKIHRDYDKGNTFESRFYESQFYEISPLRVKKILPIFDNSNHIDLNLDFTKFDLKKSRFTNKF